MSDIALASTQHAFYIMHEKIKAEKEFGPEHVECKYFSPAHLLFAYERIFLSCQLCTLLTFALTDDGAIGHFKQRRVGVEYVKGEETVNDGIVRSAHSEKVMWW